MREFLIAWTLIVVVSLCLFFGPLLKQNRVTPDTTIMMHEPGRRSLPGERLAPVEPSYDSEMLRRMFQSNRDLFMRLK